jgi:glutamate/tyrosine decarboxylase-like PLP-dependent enzyme
MNRPEQHPNDEEQTRRVASLDLAPDELKELASAFHALGLEALEGAEQTPVFPETSARLLASLFGGPLPVEGAPAETLLEECREVVRHSRRSNHPRMFGYVVSPAAPVAALASFLAAAVNQNVTSWRSAPSATTIEQTVVRWLAEMIGYVSSDASAGAGESERESGRAEESESGDDCGGLLTSGGSAANFTALFIAQRARAAQRPDAPDISRRGLWGAGAPMTVYASEHTHFSTAKAADVLGMGREQVRLVPVDGEFRLDVRALRERIEADARAGLDPFCVVANAGTVSTGAVDPLTEVARVAREYGLWFHVDGAYGALAASAPSRRRLFEGLTLADSVSLDPHKWLYTPVDCGCLLLRRPSSARAAFADAHANYVGVFEREEAESFAFWDYGLELSRPFRALKVWAMLRYHGARRVAASIAEDCELAARLGEMVREAEDFELLAPVTLGICCFRYVPPDARRELAEAGSDEEREAVERRLDELNARLMHSIQRGGVAYLSNATLRGRFALRASITNFRTTRRDLAVTLDAVRRAARVETDAARPC